jgi:hypothetical protein
VSDISALSLWAVHGADGRRQPSGRDLEVETVNGPASVGGHGEMPGDGQQEDCV